ncbi:MAG: hypothetical protein J6Y15_10525, partial [Bacteroidaceae bacterium]|nr:hypothetical protein [Bacteroidaceae bacterium]
TNMLPLRVQTEATFRGHLLIAFMASVVVRMLQDDLSKTSYNPQSTFLTIRNHKCKVFDDYVLTMESVKKANDTISTNVYDSASGAPQLLGLGIKTSITGKHADLVITDDICNITDRISRAEREKTKTQFQELRNVCNRGGRIVSLGTKWHGEDVFTLMKNIHVYTYKDTGLISDDKIEELRQDMIPSLFACNYELRIIASEDVIFTNAQTGGDPAFVQQGVMQLDSAFYGEDYTAWSIMTKHDDKYYLYGKMKRKHVEDCYEEIVSDYQRFMCGKLYNEDNADKGMVGKELRKLGVKVILYHEDMNKYVKIATYLKAIWQDLIFVEGTDPEYINQICDYFEDAEHDDAPDSAASLARLFLPKKKSDYKPLWN